MQFRMKTEEHEAIKGAKRYHRTIHRGTAKALGDPTVVDPLSPRRVRELRRERAEQYEKAMKEAKASGFDPPPKMFLVGPVDYEAGYDGELFWWTINGVYNVFPLDRFPGMFRGSIINLPGAREDYLQAVGMGVPDPTEQDAGASKEGPSGLLPRLFESHPYRVEERTARVDDVECLVVVGRWKAEDGQGEVIDRLWLDDDHGLALRRREVSVGAGLRRRVLNSELKEITPGLWMPRKVEYQFASFPTAPEETRDKPLVARRMHVLELRINDVDDALFEVKRGAKVVDLRSSTTAPPR
jgi:hypothetical protein